jgi:hypothetical protein
MHASFCRFSKICVNYHGLKQEQRCVLCFETCIVIGSSHGMRNELTRKNGLAEEEKKGL